MKFKIYFENVSRTIEAEDILTAQEEAARIEGYPGKITKISKLIPLTCCSNHCEYCGLECRDNGTPIELELESDNIQSELFDILMSIKQFNFSHRTSRYVIGLLPSGQYNSIDEGSELYNKIEEVQL